jgi:hypothetical protein
MVFQLRQAAINPVGYWGSRAKSRKAQIAEVHPCAQARHREALPKLAPLPARSRMPRPSIPILNLDIPCFPLLPCMPRPLCISARLHKHSVSVYDKKRHLAIIGPSPAPVAKGG